ncbi:MAG TPA: hypothetical protein VEU96_18605 [Bryobacteraceae bacterium]|nr:hypothetical protein [Bryobacteraceae bacterium]
MRRLFLLLAMYGAINAIAYSCLLPLWEGFDEIYHYGYVQFLSANLRLPVLGPDAISQEVWHSLQFQPVSHYLLSFTGASLSFTDYFAKSPEERVRLRQQLESIPAGDKFQPQADKPNYELNQSPLSYFLMAAIDRVLLGHPLPTRVLGVRLLSSLLAVLLIAHSTLLLAGELRLPGAYCGAALFCIFSSQMLYATLCHVCNDALAVALTGYLIWSSIRTAESGTPRDCVWLGLAASAALLTKAYFLFLVPLAVGALGWAIWKKRANLRGAIYFIAPMVLLAGPWFVRNLVLYHDLSGTSQKTAGVGPRQLLQAAIDLPWREAIVSMAHGSLWTGNNSFTTFSAKTLDSMLLLVAVALILYFVRARLQIPEWTIVAASFLFWIALLLVTLTFYAGSNRQVAGAEPWYAQVLLVPLMLLMFLGLSRAPRWGRILGPLFVLLWGYVLMATYLIKLLPLYGGFPASQRIGELWTRYFQQIGEMNAMLRTVSPASPIMIWIFVGAAVVLSAALSLRLAAAISRPAR